MSASHYIVRRIQLERSYALHSPSTLPSLLRETGGMGVAKSLPLDALLLFYLAVPFDGDAALY